MAARASSRALKAFERPRCWKGLDGRAGWLTGEPRAGVSFSEPPVTAEPASGPSHSQIRHAAEWTIKRQPGVHSFGGCGSGLSDQLCEQVSPAVSRGRSGC
jgi:hypothetical protein